MVSNEAPTRTPLIGEPSWEMAGDDENWVVLAGNLRVPQMVRVRRITDDEWDYYADVDVTFDMEALRYELTSISVHSYQLEGRPLPISARSLRTLLINKLEEKVFENERFPLVVPGSYKGRPRYGFSGLEKLAEKVRGNGPTAEALEVAALIYCAAFAIRGNPTQRIAELMNLPHRTASHWVKLARERGYLSSDPSRSIDGPRGYGLLTGG